MRSKFSNIKWIPIYIYIHAEEHGNASFFGTGNCERCGEDIYSDGNIGHHTETGEICEIRDGKKIISNLICLDYIEIIKALHQSSLATLLKNIDGSFNLLSVIICLLLLIVPTKSTV